MPFAISPTALIRPQNLTVVRLNAAKVVHQSRASIQRSAKSIRLKLARPTRLSLSPNNMGMIAQILIVAGAANRRRRSKLLRLLKLIQSLMC